MQWQECPNLPLPSPSNRVWRSNSLTRRLTRLAAAAISVAVVFAAGLGLGGTGSLADAATSDHLMCGWKAEYRPQTVSIDPDMTNAGVTYDDVIAAFAPWNALFERYHGFPIFVVHYGEWWQADILITSDGFDRTWVQGQCSPGYVQRGANHSIVFLGSQDAWRNRSMLAHELGHALGFADHGTAAGETSGHIGYKPCGNYLGVMSYCTSPQSWFLDLSLPGLLLDGQLIREYWLP